MKIVKVNDNLLINIEQIYSLSKTNNNNQIKTWEDNYNRLLEQCYQNPPEYILKGGIIFKPDFKKDNDDKLLNEYMQMLNSEIINNIGEKPEFNETYKLILASGLHINIDKNIYDKIEYYLQKYIEN